MNPAFFQAQLQRLITRFSQRAFDPEFCKLIWREVHDMSESGFQRFCDVMIGSRTHTKPPLLSEFREARMNEQRLRFDNETKQAARTLGQSGSAAEALSRIYGKVEGVMDAFEIQRMRDRVKRTDGDGGAA